MKPPRLLKIIIDIAYIFLIIKLFLGAGILIYILFGGRVSDTSLEEYGSRSAFLIIGVIELAVYGFFIYAVYILRLLIKNFSIGKLYTKYQIAGLKLVGQLIISVAVLRAIVNFIVDIVSQNKLGVSIDFKNGFGSFWLVIAIGLFFIYLSKIFAHARKIKRENDLTV